MNRIHRLSIVALAMGVLTATSANAELLIDDGSSPAPQSATIPANKPTGSFFESNTPPAPSLVSSSVVATTSSAKSTHLTQTGTPQIGAPVKGWAKDVPLSTALKQVVPNGWKARKSGAVDLNQSVSWQGGKDWVAVLGDLTSDYNFSANVNWNTREIFITPVGAASSVTSTTTTTTSVAPRPVFTGSSQTKFATPVSSSVSSGYSYSQTWTLSKSMTLRENIESWAKQAGWTVSWGAPDYRIPADVTLTGAIDSPNGPIARVIAAYKDADQPLRASLSEGNKVIRIDTRDFQQETVVGTSMNDTFTNLDKR